MEKPIRLMKCKEQWPEKKCLEPQGLRWSIVKRGQNSHNLFQIVNEICGTVSLRLQTVKDKDGNYWTTQQTSKIGENNSEELCRGSGGWVRQVEFKAGMSTMDRFFVVRQRSEKLNVVQQFNRIILKQAFNCYWQSGLILAGPEKLLNSRGVDDTRPIWRSIAYSKSMSESMSKSMSKSMSADGVGRALITEWFNITVCVYRQG